MTREKLHFFVSFFKQKINFIYIWRKIFLKIFIFQFLFSFFEQSSLCSFFKKPIFFFENSFFLHFTFLEKISFFSSFFCFLILKKIYVYIFLGENYFFVISIKHKTVSPKIKVKIVFFQQNQLY